MTTVMDEKSTTSTSDAYQTNTIGKDPAPRLDGKNLHLEIQVSDTGATVPCLEEEHVGSHANRMVTFRADRDCTLVFGNNEVFGKTEEVLLANALKEIPVVVEMSKKKEVRTDCQVAPPGRKAATQHNSPPKIVVP
jgi:hypothetical protein